MLEPQTDHEDLAALVARSEQLFKQFKKTKDEMDKLTRAIEETMERARAALEKGARRSF